MKYIDSKKLSETQFKQYTGISWSTFYVMVEQLQKHVPAKGRPPKLSGKHPANTALPSDPISLNLVPT